MVIPKIDITFNMQGIANSMSRASIGKLQPMDFYEIVNTARDPQTGQYYWNAVNYGRPAVTAHNTSSVRIKGGKEETQTTSNKLAFFASGEVQRTAGVGPVAPVHMRERVIPMIRTRFVTTMSRIMKTTTFTLREITEWREVEIFVAGIKKKYLGEFQVRPESTYQMPLRTSTGGLSPVVKQAMAITMDYAVEQLAKITPILNPKYYSKGYTPEPGELRSSYQWREIGKRTNMTIATVQYEIEAQIYSNLFYKYGFKHPARKRVERRLNRLRGIIVRSGNARMKERVSIVEQHRK